jgi:hypothetical protein
VPTIVFCATKGNGQAIVDDLVAHRHKAALLTDDDEDEKRRKVIASFKRGEITIIVNCFLMSYGVDIPGVRCIVLYRPTRSVAMYKQMIGRGARADGPAKEYYWLIDLARVVETLGLPHGDFGWTLDPARNVNREAVEQARERSQKEAIRTCPHDGTLWSPAEDGRSCPTCGWVPAIKATQIRTGNAQVRELLEDDQPPHPERDPVLTSWYQQAAGWYAQQWPDRWRHAPAGGRFWAWRRTCEKHGLGWHKMPPEFDRLHPLRPTLQVSRHLHGRARSHQESQTSRRRA